MDKVPIVDGSRLPMRIGAGGGLEVGDRVTDYAWRSAGMLALSCWDETGAERVVPVSAQSGWRWSAREDGSTLTATFASEALSLSVRCEIAAEGDMLRLRIPAGGVVEGGACRIHRITVLPEFGAATEGEDGYLVLPANLGFLCTFRDKQPATREYNLFRFISSGTMPIWGVRRGEASMLAVIEGGKFDAALRLAVAQGEDRRYHVDPVFTLRDFSDDMLPFEDISIDYLFLSPGAGWQEMAKAYRQYVFTYRGVRPIRERVKDYPDVGYAAEAIEFRIRQAWKPVPSPIEHQTPENEPKLTVRCDFEKVSRILDKFRARGIDKVEFCLVGWNAKGHDGRYPQILPVEEELGGESALRALIRKALDMGYRMVVHDNEVDAYTISEDWDEEFIIKDQDGSLVHNNCTWGGGLQYKICPRRFYERFAQRNARQMADLGLKGMHYSDVISIVGPVKCRDKQHPLTRRECSLIEKKQLQLLRDLFGGVQSEGSLDYLADVLDGALNASDSLEEMEKDALVDEVIPFWPIVYHGTIVYNVSYDTANCTCKGPDTVLRLIEYGGRPFYYLYSAFMNTTSPGWMGRLDLVYECEEDFDREMDRIEALYRDWVKLRRLQYEFIDGFDKLTGCVTRTVYSDGSAVLVNYGDAPYEYDGVCVPPHGFRLIEP